MRKIFVFLTLILCFNTVNAQYTLQLEDIEYTLSNDSLTITEYINTDEKDIVIPENFNIDGSSYIVSTIGDWAFEGNSLIGITIPNSVTLIKWAAFNNNDIIKFNSKYTDGIIYARKTDGTNDSTSIISYGGTATEINFIPNNVSTIGDVAFCDNNLTSISLGENITSIGIGAFADNSLDSVVIPNNVITIGEDAFDDNNTLTSVRFQPFSSIKFIDIDAFNGNHNVPYIILPTNKTVGFNGYQDSDGIIYQSGDSITDFNLSISTLTVPTEIKTFNEVIYHIYPNPAQNRIIIEGYPMDEAISIYSLTGKLVLHKKQGSNGIDVSSLKNGIYNIQGREGKYFSTTFIKNN